MSTSLDPLQAAGDIFNFPLTSGPRNSPLPTYRYHTPTPLSFIQFCSASHYLYLKCRSILTHQKHMSATHVRTYGSPGQRRVRAHRHTRALMYSNSLTFSLKCDMSAHCKMGPRCTPEIPGRRARMRVVSSCAARSPEFRLSSQAFLSDPDLNRGTVLPPGTLDRVGY